MLPSAPSSHAIADAKIFRFTSCFGTRLPCSEWDFDLPSVTVLWRFQFTNLWTVDRFQFTVRYFSLPVRTVDRIQPSAISIYQFYDSSTVVSLETKHPHAFNLPCLDFQKKRPNDFNIPLRDSRKCVQMISIYRYESQKKRPHDFNLPRVLNCVQ